MSSALIIGGEDPLGAQLAARLARLGHDVAATVRPHQDAEQVTQALSHRGVEVYLCDPDDPLSLSPAVAGRDEVFLCLHAAPPPNAVNSSPHAGWGGVGRSFGSLLLTLNGRRPDLLDDPFRSHERSLQRQAEAPKSGLSVALEASALSSSQAPHVTLICSMFALAPQRGALDQLYSDLSQRLYTPPAPPPNSTSGRLWRRVKALLTPPLSAPPPTWRRAHQAIQEAAALSLPCVFHGLPYHERRLLSTCGEVELLSWLRPTQLSCAPLEDLATGLILLRAHNAKGRPVGGHWFLGGDNLKLDLIEETLKVSLSPQQRLALSPLRAQRHAQAPTVGWTLSSQRARAAFGYEWRLRHDQTDERPLDPSL